MGDEGLDECFGLGSGARGDDFGDAIQGGGFRGDGCAGKGDGEFVAAGGELGCLGAQFAEPSGEEFGIESAVFEGVQVPVDRLLGFGELGDDSVQFDAGVTTGILVASLLGGDGLADQVVSGAVELAQGFEDGRVDGVGIESGEVALVGVVAGAIEAGVVTVGAGAAGGTGAAHGAPASRAAQAAGQQVVGRVRGAVGVGFPARFEN
nr:hypothetical protein [Nocardia tenerifensis]